MLMAASKFEQQMRYLKEQGYRVISMREFLEFAEGKRQLPRKAVVLSFDDGYRSFREFAEPLAQAARLHRDPVRLHRLRRGRSQRALLEGSARAAARPASTSRRTRRRTATSGGSRARATPQYAARMRDELGAAPGAVPPAPRCARPPSWPIRTAPGTTTCSSCSRQYGYSAAFTVRRESNSAFITRRKIHRSQIYGEMSIEEFARNLNVIHDEPLK